MFFSRITLREDAQQNDDFWRIFESPYALHQSIWRLFGDHPDRRRDFVYRLDQDRRGVVIYSVSKRISEANDTPWQIETKPYEPKIQSEGHLNFMLRVNPVRTREGKRHDVVMEEKRLLRAKGIPRNDWPLESELVQKASETWLRERSEKNGFNVVFMRADGYQQHKFFKAKGGHPIRFSTVDIEGMLGVTDPSLFSEILFRGLGPAKGFGCGLLLIRRA